MGRFSWARWFRSVICSDRLMMAEVRVVEASRTRRRVWPRGVSDWRHDVTRTPVGPPKLNRYKILIQNMSIQTEHTCFIKTIVVFNS